MSNNSKIEWTDHTANFWWGCQKVSVGCKNCYADVLANRFEKGLWGSPQTTSRQRKIGIWKDLPKWDRWAKKRGVRERVFVMSMGDFFEDNPQVLSWRRDALDLMKSCDGLDFLILTKRPESILEMMSEWLHEPSQNGIPDNFWFGTSVENQKQADTRIPELLKVPSKIHFLSCEPLLENVDLQLRGRNYGIDFGNWSQSIDWVIVGGESGSNARRFDLLWAYSLIADCDAAGVAVFVKQFGENPCGVPCGYKITGKGGDWNEWPVDLQFREFPEARHEQ